MPLKLARTLRQLLEAAEVLLRDEPQMPLLGHGPELERLVRAIGEQLRRCVAANRSGDARNEVEQAAADFLKKGGSHMDASQCPHAETADEVFECNCDCARIVLVCRECLLTNRVFSCGVCGISA